MATRNLYLYEVVDVVGQGQYDYMEHLWQDPVLRMPEMFGLQGPFYVCAAGGGRRILPARRRRRPPVEAAAPPPQPVLNRRHRHATQASSCSRLRTSTFAAWT